MLESEVEVMEVIHLPSELVNCIGNTFRYFFSHPPLFHDYYEHRLFRELEWWSSIQENSKSLFECPSQTIPFARLNVLTEILLKPPTFKLIFKMMSKTNKKKKKILVFIKESFKSVIMVADLVVRSVVQKQTTESLFHIDSSCWNSV